MFGVTTIGTKAPVPVLPTSTLLSSITSCTREGVSPVGITQAYSPVFMSIAEIRLKGGLKSGIPSG